MPAKVFADDPPRTWSAASEKLPANKTFTVAPGGSAVSSFIAGRVAVPVATGASFTAVTCRVKRFAVLRLPSLATTSSGTKPLAFGGGVPVNVRVAESKCSQFGNGELSASAAANVREEPSGSTKVLAGTVKVQSVSSFNV